jgi:hypothetical protein
LYKLNAFAGAKIEDPYETIAKYKTYLEQEEKADLVIPLCHLYVPQDTVTCERFDFPIVLSGHDHHVVDQVISGSRLLKPGADADNAIIIDITWPSSTSDAPTITCKTVKVADYPADPELEERVRRCYSILEHLRHTELTPIPAKFRPLSSVGTRSRPVTIGTFLWTCLREALNNSSRTVDGWTVDCVAISGGHIRGSKDYPADSFFSLEDMKSELQEKEETCIAAIPGHLLASSIVSSRSGPNPGFFQLDDGIVLSESGNQIVSIGSEPFDPEREYRVATTRWDIFEGHDELIAYFKQHEEKRPTASWPIYATIVSYFASNVWKQIWNKLDLNQDGKIDASELKSVDLDGDNRINKAEMAIALRSLGFEVDNEELSFVDCIMDIAGDSNKDGYLTLEEINIHSGCK